ncbi:OmpA family protein [Paracoccus aminovorans]|uniref:OmpA family protein n=1 Tax=Paracoccus aminovorans TaxID=34004 RepID=UPI000781A952|nr:OmpA family protein [Paracoccus aminovorans]MDQ7777875.1 OmpA family protein [Paracoccus aminovorans]
MRRIFKTTTAILACLSLIAPDLVLAQDNQGLAQAEMIRRKAEQAKEKQQQREKAAAQQKQPEKRQQQQKPAARKQPEKPAAQQPKAQAQRQKPQPQQKPPAEAQQPRPAQENARAQDAKRQDPGPKAAQKPAPAKDRQQAAKPAPQRGRDAEPGNRRTQEPMAAPKPPAQPAARQQQDRKPQQLAKPQQNGQPTRNAGNGNGEGRKQPPRAEGGQPRPAPMDADTLREKMRERDRKSPQPLARGPDGQPPRNAANGVGNRQDLTAPRSPQELRERLRQGNGAARLPAPERGFRPNDLARRAAAQDHAPAAAALAAMARRDDDRKDSDRRRDDDETVIRRKIGRDDFRRPDQEFRTSIRDGSRALSPEETRRILERRERELRREEQRLDRRERDLDRRYYDSRDDDDDDHGSDIAKLLLAGVAGFAVGKMMSNNRQVAFNSGDRAVLTLPDGSQQIVRDDNALLYRPGSDVSTENFADGSSRTTVLRADGSRVVTIRDADMNILRRTLIGPDGRETRLIGDSAVRPVQISTLPAPAPVEYASRPLDESALREALLQESAVDRRFTLGQIRDIPEVRSLVAPVNVADVTFDSGSAALAPEQAEQLATLGSVIRQSIDENPNEVYMIEGYTDAVGSPAANLALSDRRAESVALALTEYYDVPPENMVVQGYGEQFLLVPGEGDDRANRRVAVRRITDLLEQE